MKFPDVLDQVTEDLAINRLTDYIYDLACKVAEGYRKYHINNSEDKASRVLLIEATRQVLEKCFYLVGIKPLEKIWKNHPKIHKERKKQINNLS